MSLHENTEAHNIPEFLNKLHQPEELRQLKLENDRKKYEQLLSKISFVETEIPFEERKYKYPLDGMLPYVFFFKYLARKPELDNGNMVFNNFKFES